MDQLLELGFAHAETLENKSGVVNTETQRTKLCFRSRLSCSSEAKEPAKKLI
jgi:hypothetical protein